MYATVAQLAHRLQLDVDDLTEDDTAALTELLEDAGQVIDDEVGQPLLRSTDTVTLDGSGAASLILPRWPVHAVDEVTLIAVDGTETALAHREGYLWSTSGVLTRLGGCWPAHDRAVRVLYTPGYEEAELGSRVRRICLRLAVAGRRNPGGADSEDIADTRVRWHTPGMELTTAEKATLAKYASRP
ncbi:hypothetical protein AB0873_14980 [Micromonospora sp. NPDC047707]|uniref:hypothetical protein n=1 Tax=Micromonospora sp. NPDC047707 TaxID=3154498 RepID=UPI0034539BF7